VIAPPHEQARKVKTVVCMQMREEYVHRIRIGIPLQRTQHATTEIEN
jgi:hypothetical protein